MRVHFDGFKATWDEWYDQRDFNRGACMWLVCICPCTVQCAEWVLWVPAVAVSFACAPQKYMHYSVVWLVF